MTAPVTLAFSGDQHEHLKSFLFPGDGNEAVAILLCGRRAGDRRHRLVGPRNPRHPIRGLLRADADAGHLAAGLYCSNAGPRCRRRAVGRQGSQPSRRLRRLLDDG